MTPTTRKELALLVPPDGLMIELGVAAGEFAEQLLRTNPSARYVGIDRWSDHHDEAEMDKASVRLGIDTEHGSMGENCYRASLIRSTFKESADRMNRDLADLIYIDGYAHTGQEGGETLRDWWTKVKPGGIFAGHDYSPDYPLTIAAVDSFVAENGLALNVIEEKPHASWWVRKPLL